MRQSPPLNPPAPNNGVHPDLADAIEKYREEAANLNGAATTPEARANLRTATRTLDQVEHATDARGKMNVLKRNRHALGDNTYKELRDTIIHTANPPDLDLVMGKFNEDARELERQIDKNDQSQVENLKHVKDFSRAMRLTGDPVAQSKLLQDARNSIGEEAYEEFRAALNQKLLETANTVRTPEDAIAEKHGENLDKMVRRILHPTYAGNEIREDFQNLPIPESIERTGRDLLLRREKVLELMDAERRATAKGKTDSIAALQAQRLGELRTAAEAGYQQAYKAFHTGMVDELFQQESDLAGGAWDENAKKEAYKRIVIRTSLPCIQHLDQEFEKLKLERLGVASAEKQEREKGRIERMVAWYASQPVAMRVCMGAALGTGIFVTAMPAAALLPWWLGGALAAKGVAVAAAQTAQMGVGAFLTYRTGRGVLSAIGGNFLRKAFDSGVTKKFKAKRGEQEKEFKSGTENTAQTVLDEAGAFFGNAVEALEKRERLMELMIHDAQANSRKIEEINQAETKKKSGWLRAFGIGVLGGGITGALTDMFVLPRVASAFGTPDMRYDSVENLRARNAAQHGYDPIERLRTQRAATMPPPGPTLPPGPGTARASVNPLSPPSGSTGTPRVPGGGTFPGSAHAGIPSAPTVGPDTSGLPGPAGHAPGAIPVTPPTGGRSALTGIGAGMGPGEILPETGVPLAGPHGVPAEILPEHGIPLAGPHGSPSEILPEEGIPLAGPHGAPAPIPPPAPKGFFQSIREALFGAIDETGKGINKAAGTVAEQMNRATGATAQAAKDTAAATGEVGANLYETITGGGAKASSGTVPPGGTPRSGGGSNWDYLQRSKDAAWPEGLEGQTPPTGGQSLPQSPDGSTPPVESASGGSATRESLLPIGRKGPEGALIDSGVSGKDAHRAWLSYVADIKARPDAIEHQDLFKRMRAAGYSNDQITNALKGNGTQKLETLLGQAARRMKGGNVLYDPQSGKMSLTEESFLKPTRPRVSHQPTASRPRVRPTRPSATMLESQTPPPRHLNLNSSGGQGGAAEQAVVDHTVENARRFGFVGHFASQIKTVENVDVATYLREVKRLAAEQAADRPLTSNILPDAYAPGYLDKHVRLADTIEATARKGLGGRLPPDYGRTLPMKAVLKNVQL